MSSYGKPTAEPWRGSRGHRSEGLTPSQSQDITPCQVLRNAQGRVIGEVRGDTLTKRVRGSKHMLQKPPAWACDLAALAQAEQMGVRWVVVVDTETGTRYRVLLEYFLEHGFRFNRGFGEQVGLPLDRWQKSVAGQPEAVQLALAF